MIYISQLLLVVCWDTYNNESFEHIIEVILLLTYLLLLFLNQTSSRDKMVILKKQLLLIITPSLHSLALYKIIIVLNYDVK